jgi:hypothetical protein
MKVLHALAKSLDIDQYEIRYVIELEDSKIVHCIAVICIKKVLHIIAKAYFIDGEEVDKVYTSKEEEERYILNLLNTSYESHSIYDNDLKELEFNDKYLIECYDKFILEQSML